MNSSLSHFDEYIDELAATIDAPKHIVAWSMGGLIAIALARRYQHLVEKICFICSVPNFVSQNNKYAGIDYAWFEAFSQQYQQQPIRMLKKFLALQVKDDEFAKATLIELKQACQFGGYNLTECRHGLELLRTLNFMTDLSELNCDTIFIQGGQDHVVNKQASQHAASLSNSQLYVLEQAAHVPHISHANQTAQIIREFFN